MAIAMWSEDTLASASSRSRGDQQSVHVIDDEYCNARFASLAVSHMITVLVTSQGSLTALDVL